MLLFTGGMTFTLWVSDSKVKYWSAVQMSDLGQITSVFQLLQDLQSRWIFYTATSLDG